MSSQRGRLAAWCLVGLSAGLPAAAPPSAGSPSRLIIGVRGDVTSFNVYTATNAFSQDVADLIYPRLAGEQDDFLEGPPTFRPGLASSWAFSQDGLTLTVKLDPRARWADGRPLTSEDVLFSHRAASSPEVGWVGRDVKDRIAEVAAPDAGTIVYRFRQPYPYQLMDVVDGNILPAAVFSAIPFAEWPARSFREAPSPSGPFRLKRYEPRSIIELERNPGYHVQGRPRLETVVFRVIPDENTLLNELLAGGIDMMENVPARAVQQVERSPRLRVVRSPDLSYTYICWNTSRPLFGDPRVRRALTLALDRQAMVEGPLGGAGREAVGPVLSFLWARHPGLKPHPYDPQAASRLLKEAGWSDGDGDGVLDRDGTVFRFELETNQGSGLRWEVAQMASAQLRRVGIEAVARVVETGAFLEKHERHDFDAFVGSIRESTKVDLWSVLHSAAGAGGYNHGLYSNARLDAIIEQARAASDAAAARELWMKAQEIVHQEQPFTFLFEPDRFHAVPRALKGPRPSPRSAYVALEEWTWEPASGAAP
ncbi:MAG TPA: ABC transporter substrate-binding protein [Candidatus Polarisedimenticolia bacterium]|nr:ABC transporter substrate-binding protein [Candidatus Polarisedimenticolia bacterium]